MLTVGLGGGSCSGKTSIARKLLELLPSSVVLHQDSYYRNESDSGHVLHPGTNSIDWEVLQAFHMDRMVLDAKSALASHQKRTYRKPPSATSPSRRSLSSLEAALPTHIVSALENVSHLPLLMIEGICVLNEPRLAEMCHLKFFLEIDEGTCRARRETRGEWGEEHDDSECWSETPEYFRQVAWPGYLSNRQGLSNLPGVIFLDSTTSTVDQQLVEVLNRVLSHLQDQL